ncbi:uncharacterized protein [Dendropsophus ebraccatus]|uniref:uncharacterized protein isoform X2 n=1 Tax=Dendropsophus ebraccatus TaxID=150705 RepID=UPI00383161AC
MRGILRVTAAITRWRLPSWGPGAVRNMGAPRPLLYLLLLSLGATDGLRVTMRTPQISVLRGEEAAILCEFSEFTPGKTINVHWTRPVNGSKAEVYRYIPGRPEAFREGAYMEAESDIQRGNATLHLPRVQFSDEGEYTCTVLVTPESREGKSSLQVSAVPSAVLVPGDAIHVEVGSERSVACEVTTFYPKDITIQWVRYQKDSSVSAALQQRTCTGDPINNTDGTFNVTSHLTLYPTMEDDGHRYSCVVRHRSLEQDLKKDFTLTVTEQEDNSGMVVTAVVLTLLSVTLLLFTVFLYNNVIKKDPPNLSEIFGNDQLIDMSRTTLTCHITSFRPNDLEISVGLKRRGAEMMMIHTWRSRDADPSAGERMEDNDGGGRVAVDIEQQRLMNGDVSHTQGPLQLNMRPIITPNRSGLLRCVPWRRLHTYSGQCSLHITPSYWEDNEAEFSVHVSHPALAAAVSKKRTLRIIGVPPRLLKIVSPVYMTHQEPMTLTCPIIGFKPKPLHITWLKKDQKNQETEIVTWKSNEEAKKKDGVHNVTEDELDDKSYSFQSALIIRPHVTEDTVRYVCRTYHPPTHTQAEQELELKVTAVPVLDPIKMTVEKRHEGDKIREGDKITLSCKIHSFYPEPIDITWYKDGESMESTVTDLRADDSSLYQITSSMSYTTTMADRGKMFKCEVGHESTGAPRTATWTLEDIVCDPKVSEIRCDPPSPEYNKMVTLSCDVSDLYPKDIQCSWHRDITRMRPEMCREIIQEDPGSGRFSGTLAVEFIADAGCHEENFRMELIHCGKTIVKRHRLILGGFPALGDITSDPQDPSYGQPVTLRCKVTNAHPQDIKVQWLRGEKPLEKGQEEKQIPEKDGSVSCSLRFTATALDCGKAYTCSVIHKDMREPLRKSHYVQLPDKVPIFSDITVRPDRPVAGKDATCTVTISGFTPDIKVKWYKDFNPFPSHAVTTSDPEIGKDSLCTCTSSLRFTPGDKDNMAAIRCEVTHSVTKKVYVHSCTLNLAGAAGPKPEPGHLRTPLKTRGIQCLTESPRVGGEVTLTCYVEGCDADSSEFFWRRGMFPIDGDVQNKCDGSGSFSTVTFTAQETDRDCTVTCEVTYNLETLEEHFTLKLQ